MTKVRILVFSGYGINCEKETALACHYAGGHPEIHHLHDLLRNQIDLNAYRLICFPGGFSFGDDLGGAKALANRLEHCGIREKLEQFVANGNCILGICNGFQLLVKLGILPGTGHRVSLAHNDEGQFIDKWIAHKVHPSPCLFTKGIETLYLPIRHGEGKFIAEDAQQLFDNRQVVLEYAPDNPNGSERGIGGICDPTGRVFGMMAHPEAAILTTQHPHWTRMEKPLPTYGAGLKLFTNVVNYLMEQVCITA